jgi:hypothetical protein
MGGPQSLAAVHSSGPLPIADFRRRELHSSHRLPKRDFWEDFDLYNRLSY